MLDRIFGRKEVETYVLKRQLAKGGYAKVADVGSEAADIEAFSKTEIFASLAKGIYVLHRYRKGKSGFEVVWGPVGFGESEEEAAALAEGAPRGKTLTLEEQVEKALGPLGYLEKLASIYDERFGLKAFLRNMKASKELYSELGSVFGGGERVTGKESVPYEGKLPIWMHPDVIPGMIDRSLNTVETRLKDWGMIETKEEKAAGEELLKIPPKPKPAPPSPEVSEGEIKETEVPKEETEVGEEKQPEAD